MMKKTDKDLKKVSSTKRQYAPPKVLSAEQLEAAAATCNPPAGGFGKAVGPGGCGTSGS